MATALPIVSFERRKWYFDERLSELRLVGNQFEVYPLNEFEVFNIKENLKKDLSN